MATKPTAPKPKPPTLSPADVQLATQGQGENLPSALGSTPATFREAGGP